MTVKANNELLRVDDLHKQYGDNEVLKGVSLTAHSGDVISIIGSSGSGKSTWLRCINFLEQPTSGKIIVAGEEIKMLAGSKDALKVLEVPRHLPGAPVGRPTTTRRDCACAGDGTGSTVVRRANLGP